MFDAKHIYNSIHLCQEGRERRREYFSTAVRSLAASVSPARMVLEFNRVPAGFTDDVLAAFPATPWAYVTSVRPRHVPRLACRRARARILAGGLTLRAAATRGVSLAPLPRVR
jgi:hypothetical protein